MADPGETAVGRDLLLDSVYRWAGGQAGAEEDVGGVHVRHLRA